MLVALCRSIVILLSIQLSSTPYTMLLTLLCLHLGRNANYTISPFTKTSDLCIPQEIAIDKLHKLLEKASKSIMMRIIDCLKTLKSLLTRSITHI
jgi:hypothetical protein